MIKINGKPIDFSKLQANISSSNVLTILQLMEKYPTVIEFETMKDFQFELVVRLNVIQAAVLLDQSGAEFTILEESVCNPYIWRLASDGAFQLQPMVPPHVALNDIFTNGSLYAFECGTAILVVFYKAILDAIGPTNFDRIFSNLFLYNWHYHQNLSILIHEDVDYLPGDCVYFINPDFAPNTPEWQGENAIMLREDLYFAHGVGISNQQDIIQELNSNRIMGSMISAYLTTHIINIDSSQYRPFKVKNLRDDDLQDMRHLAHLIVCNIGSKTYLA